MSSIVQTIKQHTLSITGKRRLSILQKYINKNYKKPEHALRNVVGEYSPKQIMLDLRQLSTGIKGLCANNGRSFIRNYSYAQLESIQNSLAPLAALFEQIQNSTGQNTLRDILYKIPQHIESIKQVMGPFSDFKSNDIIIELRNQINEYSDQHSEFEALHEEVKNATKEIQSNLTKSRKLKEDADALIQTLSSTHKDFTGHEKIAKEMIKRIQTISTSTNTIQTKIEKSIIELQDKETSIEELANNIKTKSDDSTYLSNTIRETSQEIDTIRSELQYLTAQARHALHINHGAGVAESYRKLAEKSKYRLPYVTLISVALLSFTVASFLTVTSYFSIRDLLSINDIFKMPLLLGTILFIPVLLVLFLTCIGNVRKRMKQTASFSNKVAALESFLHVSDRFPYDSPEKLNTANYIFSIIRKDFGLEHDLGGYVKQEYHSSI